MSDKSAISITSNSDDNTAQIAADFARKIQAPCLICLNGDLGAGKSVFARSFIQTLTSPDTDVPSPTFTLLQYYESETAPIYHYDLYRIEDAEEVYELNWEDALYSGIVLVEWPQRAQELLPARRWDVTITPIDQTTRKINIDERN